MARVWPRMGDSGACGTGIAHFGRRWKRPGVQPASPRGSPLGEQSHSWHAQRPPIRPSGDCRMVRNTLDDWGWPAKLLHWLGALLILLLLGHGCWMTR